MNIATGSNITNLAFYYKEFDLGRWFDITLCAYDDGTMNAKPAPDMYIRAMVSSGTAPIRSMAR
ncbi:HAD family hydrolase, partial [Coprococcus eutactus]